MQHKVTLDWNEVEAQITSRFPVEGPANLSKEYGLSRQTIWRRAKALGLNSPRASTLQSNKKDLREDYFLIWSPSMAYYLGYVTTDGSVCPVNNGQQYALELECVTEDEDILVGFKLEVGSHHKLMHNPGYVDAEGYFHRPKTRLHVCNDRMARSLINIHGILPNKSNLDLPLPVVPSHYRPHFFRGFLDGDGSVSTRGDGSRTALSFKGSHRMMSELRDQLLSVLALRPNKLTLDKDSPTLSCLTWSSEEDLKSLYNWLYPPGTYSFLLRKRSKLQEAVS